MPSAGYKYLPLGICVTRVARKNGRGGTQKRGAAREKNVFPQNKKGRKNIPAQVSGKGSATPPVTRGSLCSLRVCRRLRPLLDLLLPLLRAADLLS